MQFNIRYFLVVIIGLAVGILVSVYYFSLQSVEDSKASKKVAIVLPETRLEKIGPCFVGSGQHYMRAEDIDSDGPSIGPTFLKLVPSGEVVGIEYHIDAEEAEKQLSDIFKTTPPNFALPIMQGITKFPLYGATYDHMTLSYEPMGHPGYAKAHFDVHLFTKDPIELEKFGCPPETSAAPTH